MIRPRRWFFIAVLSLASGPARAGDVQVNTYTTNDQRQPSVAMAADGAFVVVWESLGSVGTDSSLWSVQGRRYASGATPAGGEIQINTYTTGAQERPSVAMAADGGFVVVWASDGSAGTDSSLTSIQAQRYAAGGSPSGGELQVNTYTWSLQHSPSVAMAADGAFVVVWESFGSTGTDWQAGSIQGRRFAAGGEPVGRQFQVNAYTTNQQSSPSIALAADGAFVVVWDSWESSGADSSLRSIQGRRFAADGEPTGAQFEINTYTTSHQVLPSVALAADGDFVVAWQSNGSGGTDSGYSIQAQRFAADGEPAGGEFQVNTTTTFAQLSPSVALAADGDFVVVWSSLSSGGTDSSSDSIQARRFAADGSPVGGEFQVNTYTTNQQSSPAVSIGGAGDYVIVWGSSGSGGTDTHRRSVQMRLSPWVESIFADGFESGDTSAWSAVP